VTGYHLEPPPPAPGRGYPDPGPGGAVGSPPPTADYRAAHGRAYAGGGSDDYPLPPLPPEFAPDRPAGYASGAGPGGYRDPPADGFGSEPDRGYPPGPGGPLAASGYGDGRPAAHRYDDERRAGPGGYGEPGYHGHGSGGYPADSGTGGYPSYPAEAGYSDGPGYSDAPGYPDAPGYQDYPEEYPSYPPGEQQYPGYPPGQPYQDYPPEPGSPDWPYVTGPDADDAGPADGDQTEPRKPRGRRAAGTAPESFPYGSRQRGGYPGQ
jgi:hypothetical protein